MTLLAVIGKGATGPFAWKDSTNTNTIFAQADTGAFAIGIPASTVTQMVHGANLVFGKNSGVTNIALNTSEPTLLVNVPSGAEAYIRVRGGDMLFGTTSSHPVSFRTNGIAVGGVAVSGAWDWGPATTPLAGIRHIMRGYLTMQETSQGDYFIVDTFQKSAVGPSTVPLFNISLGGSVQGSVVIKVTITQCTRLQGINNYNQVFEAVYTQIAGGSMGENVLHNLGSATTGVGSVSGTIQNNPSRITFNGTGNGAANYAISFTVCVQAVSLDGSAVIQPFTYTRM